MQLANTQDFLFLQTPTARGSPERVDVTMLSHLAKTGPANDTDAVHFFDKTLQARKA